MNSYEKLQSPQSQEHDISTSLLHLHSSFLNIFTHQTIHTKNMAGAVITSQNGNQYQGLAPILRLHISINHLWTDKQHSRWIPVSVMGTNIWGIICFWAAGATTHLHPCVK